MIRALMTRSLLVGLMAGFCALPAMAQSANPAFSGEQK